ncbi:MAG TPA: copper resistance protein B [Terricaulis sp.]|mgnify:CR=1 FL=1|nr:copper resistance protein B [Terricaulis sp.]
MRLIAATIAPIVLVTAFPAAAQDHAQHREQTVQADPHAGHAPTPPSGEPTHAADLYFDPAEMARARERLRIENGQVITSAIVIEHLEATFGDDEEGYAWHAQGWYGGDIHRFWWKTEGEGAFGDKIDDAELQLLYSRAVTPYFDVQAGFRQSYAHGEDRADLVVGVQGLAPYWFEVGAAAFVSTEGDVTARAEAEYDLRLTQRLILQPSAELNLATRDIADLALGAGVTDASVGLRLRYEISRRFAPYVGVEWESALGETRNIRRAAGDDIETKRAMIGVRTWF